MYQIRTIGIGPEVLRETMMIIFYQLTPAVQLSNYNLRNIEIVRKPFCVKYQQNLVGCRLIDLEITEQNCLTDLFHVLMHACHCVFQCHICIARPYFI